MIDVFGWLRKKARDAVLGGIADAVQEVAPGDAPPDLDGLRALLARADLKALAADPDPEPAKRKAK